MVICLGTKTEKEKKNLENNNNTTKMVICWSILHL